MRHVIASVIAFSFPFTMKDFLHETNSAAATKRAAREFEQRQYEKALADYIEAERISESPVTTFNRGTAEVATGKVKEAIASLSRAAGSPELRNDALYNRGNAHLAEKAFDRAIADYESVLRAEPSNVRAKRNLEIALRRKQHEESKSRGGGGQNSDGGAAAPQRPAETNPQPQHEQSQAGRQSEVDVESLLRSVEQQEREELSRMRSAKPQRRKVGW